MSIDTLNKFLVGVGGDGIVIMRPPSYLSADDAMILAAYLVSLAEPSATHKFPDVLNAVLNA